MRKLICLSILAGGLVLVAFLGAPNATASFTASVDCDFVSSGRGSCVAYPQGSGYSYSWSASGAAVSNRDFPYASASCGGSSSTITVQVSHSSGASDSASTSASCP